MVKQFFPVGAAALAALVSLAAAQTAIAQKPISTQPAAAAQSSVMPGAPGIVMKLRSTNERLEMTVNSSRIVSLERQVPQVQVNNPEILQLTVLSPNQVQLSAKKAGVTQVNIWDEKNQIFTIDVIVFGDARELQEMLKSQFPNTSLEVTPVANSVVISGFVDKPEIVPHIIRIAEEYYPKVINNIVVGGVHQVLLHCKVMEVSRTKLRALGFDWAKLTGNNIIESTSTGVLSGLGSVDPYIRRSVVGKDNTTFFFQVLDGSGTAGFFGVLKALREDNLLKIMSEPTLVCYSGRPATFLVGGEFPILVPQSLGTVSIEYKEYGTQLDFVPIVLGNGRIRLEVRPRVTEIDDSRSVVLDDQSIPALKVRTVETGVELDAGQTLAIAGLVEERIEGGRRGLPWVGEMPYIGALFGGIDSKKNDIELLILVTPELVDALNPGEVPPCLPGTMTEEPSDWELYMKRHLEVPKCCPPGTAGTGENGANCQECNKGEVIINSGDVGNGSQGGGDGQLPGFILQPTPAEQISPPAAQGTTSPAARRSTPGVDPRMAAVGRYSNPANRYTPYNRTGTNSGQTQNQTGAAGANKTLPGFIGPVGYDVVR